MLNSDDQPEITDVMENEESNLCDTEEADVMGLWLKLQH